MVKAILGNRERDQFLQNYKISFLKSDNIDLSKAMNSNSKEVRSVIFLCQCSQ